MATVAGDRHDVEVEIGRVAPVDCDFRVARRVSLLERREIHEGEVDGPLDLVDVWARKKHCGAMSIDTDY